MCASRHAPSFEKVDAFRPHRVLQDPSVAHKICSEAALIIQTCNNIIRVRKQEPAGRTLSVLGLSVEGHTSDASTADDIDKALASMQTSSKRARLAGDLIETYLRKIEDEEDENSQPAFIVACGMGATRPLPGYDDGANYECNRRVEIRLLLDHEAEEAESADPSRELEKVAAQEANSQRKSAPGGTSPAKVRAPKK